MALTDNTQGAFFMMASMTAFAVNDTFTKLMGDHLPLFQILFLRSIGTVLFLAVFVIAAGHLTYRYSPHDRKLIAIRSVAEIGAAVCFITALFHLPLANVTAIIQALPLTVTLAAAFLFRERVGWRRLGAISVGFLGVLVIIRPGAEGFDAHVIYALGAVFFVTVRDLAARRLSRDVPSASVALLTSCAVLLFSGVGALGTDWQDMDGRDWVWMAASVGAIIVGYLFSVMAVRQGEIGYVAPFRYFSLIVALLLGFLVFGDWPDRVTIAGVVLVVATGLFTLFRERTTAGNRITGLRPR